MELRPERMRTLDPEDEELSEPDNEKEEEVGEDGDSVERLPEMRELERPGGDTTEMPGPLEVIKG